MTFDFLKMIGLDDSLQQVVALCSILGHLIGDFPLQTNRLVKQRKEKLLLSWWMYAHPAIHGLITAAVLYMFGVHYYAHLIFFGGFVALLHGLTDLVKDLISRRFPHPKAQPYFFAIDQLLHLAVLVFVASLAGELSYYGKVLRIDHLPEAIVNAFLKPRFLMITIGYAVLWWPMRYFIPLVLAGFLPQNVDSQDATGQLGLGLPGAGQLIGRLERVLILTFVLLGRWEAIGFLLTAKSILRFPELSSNAQLQATHPHATPSPLTPEYVIAGTLLSMGGAVLMGVVVG